MPAEFALWQAAVMRHERLFWKALASPLGSEQHRARDAEGVAAKVEADRLEQLARAAWLRKR